MTDQAPRSIRILGPMPHLEVTHLNGDEVPVRPTWSHREVEPCHQSGDFAVYETYPGRYEVMRNGEVWGESFQTSDVALATQVCDAWAREFGNTP